ncbi:hypothetical protein TVAG_474190 [Trichomonas vaginalis G3]|uniref:Uncharacterized protein n=1 Tax=Trichomonas vaginalis (strain ATCC PRA-98 / G3) TaxID=412133 RepID=A2EQ65_TRIV3|nr:hypothetical protein TVAGG3_0072270 [Trichomonas vaginalis G3]EAY05240.1 hypothetical protein TVAG_474190 [Trichomonas vaginalis G3]KAI5542587.1 hypothetical protein TVAGG3_0072270 [Trichomonas vaginalis G3]|eukprot:XP_001317463.1 hypothetical protein [Trichomonas vaginalis G3]
MKTKFCKSIVSEIRKSVKYNTGRRIIEVIRIVNSVFTSNCDNPVEILQDCLIASGVDDFIVSFLYYIHLLTVFPQFIKDEWMESNRMIVAVRDTMFINMMAVSKKLYQYIANFFYDNDLSPLMLK